MAWLEGEGLLDRLELLRRIQRMQARGEVRPQGRVARVGPGRTLEQLARARRLAPLHHREPELVQHRRMRGGKLRDPRQQLLRLNAPARRTRRAGSLDHPEHGGIVSGRSIGVGQEHPLCVNARTLNSSVAGPRTERSLPESGALDIALIRVAALLESDPAAAVRAAQELHGEPPEHPAAALLLAEARRRSGDAQAAAAAFGELAAAQPHSAALHLELGRALLAEGKLAESFAALTRALELEPDLAEAWRELSGLHAARGEWRECDVAYA